MVFLRLPGFGGLGTWSFMVFLGFGGCKLLECFGCCRFWQFLTMSGHGFLWCFQLADFCQKVGNLGWLVSGFKNFSPSENLISAKILEMLPRNLLFSIC